MNSIELRQKYLDFFKARGHTIISSASLIPENDPTVLFTTAGMHPLVPYLLGESHPAGSRLVSIQKCIRTGDIDEVGDLSHHTFFEMLGNWSLGDYFKKTAIHYSWEFLTGSKQLNLDPNRLAVSVFMGDEDAPFDEQAYNIWKEIFVSNNLPVQRIAKLPKENNWWGPAGHTGPCGPDTEIFYWLGDLDKIPTSFNDDNDSWLEIWNNVFMQYIKDEAGKYEPLAQKNVDTGLGLERILAVLNGLKDNYRTDLFAPLISKIEELSGHKYADSLEITRAIRIIADHIKAAVMIMGDNQGVAPSNTDQGYIVRRLIRRAIRYGRQLNISTQLWTLELAQVVINNYHEAYPELQNNKKFIFDNLEQEEIKFSHTLESGLKELDKLIKVRQDLNGHDLFTLYQSYGFPLELSLEELAQRQLIISESAKLKLKQEFTAELKKHQELSRTASVGKFKGGLADASEETTKLHTAAHLLLASLRQVLGKQVVQKGSNITPERLRLDFSYSQKMTSEQLQQVEELVNGAIQADYPVVSEELSLADAQRRGAMGVFTSKYGERVKVYTITTLDSHGHPNIEQAFSQEICGGPHVSHTGLLGHFVIQKEISSSAGVRRIKAILQK